MYAQAAAINPSSTLVRDGRFKLSLRWVRSFHVDKELLNQTLDSITEILYRGLVNADADQTATILAHVGYVQVIRKFSHLPIFTDVDSLFRQALDANPDNAYANAMHARWTMLGKPMTVEQLLHAEQLFDKALTMLNTRYFVRRLQFSAFTPYTYGYSDDIETTALTVLLKAGIKMLAQDEDLPVADSRYKILDGYGRMGKAEHVETLIDALPAADHLKVYEWLLATDDDSRIIMAEQATYVRARLNEQLGNPEIALDYYHKLLGTETREEIAALVDQGIERLTGQPPERALARNYRDDEVDKSNPFQFHLDTLEHFDPAWRGANFIRALAYFENQVSENPDRLTALAINLPTFINRVRENLRQGDEIEKLNAYTSGFNSWHHDNVRQSWVDLALLHAKLLKSGNQLEQALAQLGDVARAFESLDPDWRPIQAHLDYELATIYAALANSKNRASDREQAILFLMIAVEKGVTESGRFPGGISRVSSLRCWPTTHATRQ